MKAADQDIGPEPVDDIQDASVGAAAEQNLLPVFFHKQILFVTEIFRSEGAVFQHGKAESAQRVVRFCLTAAAEGYAVGEDGGVVGKDQLPVMREGGVQSDVFFGAVVMRLEGMEVYLNWSGTV